MSFLQKKPYNKCMFNGTSKSEENLYILKFNDKKEKILSYALSLNNFNFEKNEEFLEVCNPSFLLTLTKDSLFIKVLSNLIDDDIERINNLIKFLKLDIFNELDLLVFKNEEIDNQVFFKEIPEDLLLYFNLKNYIEPLTKLGLDFDESLILEKTDSLDLDDNEFMAIDCKDYIKFIPFSQYNKEKQVEQIIKELSSQTSKEEIVEWLESIYRRHLIKNSFDSNAINHILDWLNQLSDLSILKKSLSYDKAVAKSEQWTEIENQKLGITTLKDKEGKDVETVLVDGEYSLLKLISNDSKKREGSKMHNCIGRLHLNNQNLYSLRYKGRRVASINFSEKVAKEIKGPYNKSVEKQHRETTIKILENLGIIWSSSNDLFNIGGKMFSFSIDQKTFNFFITEKDPLFHLSLSSLNIDDIYELVPYNNKESVINNYLEKLPSSIRESVKESLKSIEQKYQICPISLLMTKKIKEYSLYRIPKIKKAIEKYPIFLNIWQSNFVFNDKKNIDNNLKYSLINMLSNNESFDEKTLKILKEVALIVYPSDDDISFHPAFYNKILPGKDFNGIISQIASYTDFDTFRRNLDYVDNLLKINIKNDIRLDFDKIKINKPETCDYCNNYEKFEDQYNLVDEINSLGENFEEKLKEIYNLFDEIQNVIGFQKKIYFDFHKLILKDKSFNLIDAKLNIKTLSSYKEFIVDVNKFMDDLEENLKDFDKCNDYIEKLYSLSESIDKMIETVTKENASLSKIYGEKCSGCSECSGNDEECLNCAGKGSPCDSFEIIDDNSRQESGVYYSNPLLRSWGSRGLDFSFIYDINSSFNSLVNNRRELILSLMSFFKDFENS